MPSSDYANAVGGGLKLKGAKDAGIDKKKRKKKDKAKTDDVGVSKAVAEDEDKSAEQKALVDEERAEDGQEDVKQAEAETKQYGKTEAQRRHDERRRKRVSSSNIWMHATVADASIA